MFHSQAFSPAVNAHDVARNYARACENVSINFCDYIADRGECDPRDFIHGRSDVLDRASLFDDPGPAVRLTEERSRVCAGYLNV